MADKKYNIAFELTDGTTQNVEFTAPQGEPGKSSYEYAKDGGYKGTEAEFAEDSNPDNMKAEVKSYVDDVVFGGVW